MELLAFGVYKKVGQRARERAKLAAERVRLALEQRGQARRRHGGSRGTGRRPRPGAGRPRTRPSKAACRPSASEPNRPRQAAEAADAVRAQAGLLAAVRDAGRRGGPGRTRSPPPISGSRPTREAGRRCGQRRGGGRTSPRHAARPGSRGSAGSRLRSSGTAALTRLQAPASGADRRDGDRGATLALGLEEAEQEAEHARATGRRRSKQTRPTRSPKACGSANPARCASSRSPRCPTMRRRQGLMRSEQRSTPPRSSSSRQERPRRGQQAGGSRRGHRGLHAASRPRDVAASLAAAPAESEVTGTLEAIARADETLGQAREAVRTAPPGPARRPRRTARTSPRTRPGPGPTCAGRATRWWVSARPPSRRATWPPPGRRWPTWAAQQHARRSRRLPGPGRRGRGPAAGGHRGDGRAARPAVRARHRRGHRSREGPGRGRPATAPGPRPSLNGRAPRPRAGGQAG